MGCYWTQKTRVQSAVDDVASNIREVLPLALLVPGDIGAVVTDRRGLNPRNRDRWIVLDTS